MNRQRTVELNTATDGQWLMHFNVDSDDDGRFPVDRSFEHNGFSAVDAPPRIEGKLLSMAYEAIRDESYE